MSWLGGGLASFTDQISSLTKDILTEGTEEVGDPSTELKVAQTRIKELEAVLSSQKLENERSKEFIREAEEKAETSEFQVNSISREYRTLLQEKENEIKELKARQHEFLEAQKLSVQSAADQVQTDTFHAIPSTGITDYPGDEHEFGDSISMQHDINRLRKEVQRLKSEVVHWKRAASDNGAQSTDLVKKDDTSEVTQLHEQIKVLQHDLSSSREKHQQEVVALQDHHRSQLATLNRKHKQEIELIQDEGMINDTDPQSKPELGNGVIQQQHNDLQEELKQLKSQLEMAESERDTATHMLTELENTTSEMKMKSDQLEKTVSELEEELSTLKSEHATLLDDVTKLQESLNLKDVELSGAFDQVKKLTGDNKEVRDCLFDAEQYHLDLLDSNHAHVLEVLGDLQHVRHQVGDETFTRQKQLLQEKQHLVNDLINAGEKKSEIMQDIEDAKKSQTTLETGTENIIQSLGGSDNQELASNFKKMETEILTLKEKNCTFQEQVNQLEKTVVDLKKEKTTMERKMKESQDQWKEEGLFSETESQWDISMDKTSGPVTSTPHVKVRGSGESSDTDEVKHLQSQITLYKDQLVEYDCMKSDWMIEKEALEDVLMDLRKQLKQHNLTTTQSDKEEVVTLKKENAILQDQLTSLRKELETLTQQKSEIVEKTRQTDAAMVELENLKKTLDQKESSLLNLSTDNTELEASLEELDRQHTEEMEELIKIKNGLHSQNEILKQQVKEQETKILDLSSEVTQLQTSTADEMERSSLEMSQELSEVSEELEIMKKEHQSLLEEKANQSQELETLTNKLNKESEILSELNMDKDNLEDQMKLTVKQLDETKVKLVTATTEHSEVDRLFRQTLEKLEMAEKRLEGLEESTAFDSSTQEHLEEELEALRYQLNESLEQNTSQKTDILDLQAQLNLSQGETVVLQKERQAFEQRLNDREDIASSVNGDQDTVQLQTEIQKLKTQIEALKSEKETLEKELHQSEQKFHNQHKNYENYILDLQKSQALDSSELQEEHNKAVQISHEKDVQISHLEEEIVEAREEMADSKETVQSAVDSQQQLSGLVSEKEAEILELRRENLNLTNKIEEGQKLVDDLKQKATALSETENQLSLCQGEIQVLKHDLEMFQSVNEGTSHDSDKVEARTLDIMTDMESELCLVKEKMKLLETNKKELSQVISDQEASITDLNEKTTHQRKILEDLNDTVSKQDAQIVVLQQKGFEKESELTEVKGRLSRATSLIEEDKLEISKNSESPLVIAHRLPSLEYPEKGTLDGGEAELRPGDLDKNAYNNTNGHLSNQWAEESDSISVEIDKLQKIIKEKDEVIEDLQRSNSSFIKMLEAKSLTSGSDKALVEVHKLETEVRALKTEREQILAVMNEKSRESSKLKSEVHRLMNIISAEKTALDKLTQDNNHLTNNRASSPNEDMQKEALQNLSRIVRDKDLEIEALTQKSQTLLQVLQDSSQDGSQLSSLMQDKENLSKQLSVFQAERDQMIAYVNQKHQESVAYHNEVQRLTALINSENEKYEKIQTDYANLVPQFEDKTKDLVKTQNELINFKQKYAELEVKYGGLVQKSNVTDVVDRYTYNLKDEEASKFQERLTHCQTTLQTKEGKINSLNQRVGELELSVSSLETEKNNYKKQIEHLSFQMNSLKREVEVVRQDSIDAEKGQTEQNSEFQNIREANDKIMLSVREKEFEVGMLREKCDTLTSMLQQKDGEESQLDRLLRDNEAANEKARNLQHERDQLMVVLRQRQAETDQLKERVEKSRLKEEKLKGELDRLRNHLLQIEEGYTQEALAAEEREKELRNRLAGAEEKLLSSSAAVENVNLHAGQQLESLQQQLMMIGGQRDAAYHQVATLQEQCQQYSASLANLQLVLEQFQQDRESTLANDTDRYRAQITQLSTEVTRLKTELASTQAQLEEALDGLEAAARLSEQLDKKEAAIEALREEVQLREQALKSSEDEKKKLATTSEARIDKVLVRNLLVGYLSAPQGKQNEALKVVGVVLNFSTEDYHKVMGDRQVSWVPGFLRFTRQQATPPLTPTRLSPSGLDKSFSELFVKFLEKESSPPPPVMHLPAEQMAKETQQKQKEKEKEQASRPPQFNPFTAPRHAVMPLQIAGRSSPHDSHLLISSSPTLSPAMPMFTPVSGQEGGVTVTPVGMPTNSGKNSPTTSSSILKDVLGNR